MMMIASVFFVYLWWSDRFFSLVDDEWWEVRAQLVHSSMIAFSRTDRESEDSLRIIDLISQLFPPSMITIPPALSKVAASAIAPLAAEVPELRNILFTILCRSTSDARRVLLSAESLAAGDAIVEVSQFRRCRLYVVNHIHSMGFTFSDHFLFILLVCWFDRWDCGYLSFSAFFMFSDCYLDVWMIENIYTSRYLLSLVSTFSDGTNRTSASSCTAGESNFLQLSFLVRLSLYHRLIHVLCVVYFSCTHRWAPSRILMLSTSTFSLRASRLLFSLPISQNGLIFSRD